MSHHEKKITAQFFLTATQPCPYLPDREERKVFTTLRGADAVGVNDELSLRGFRRSQSVAYRPSCPNCSSCLSTRIPVNLFEPSRAQRRIARRSADLQRQACAPWATEEQYQLFRRYLDARHRDGGMAEMDVGEFTAMIEETPVRSRLVEYHDVALPRGAAATASSSSRIRRQRPRR
jgi:arginine-tRNA-protein transferase